MPRKKKETVKKPEVDPNVLGLRAENRFSCILIPYNCRLSLICNANRRNIFSGSSNLVHCLYCNAKLTRPNLIRIMFYPSWLRKILCKFTLCHTAHFSFFIKQNTSITCCTCIQCHYIFCHFIFLLFMLTIILDLDVQKKRNVFTFPFHSRLYWITSIFCICYSLIHPCLLRFSIFEEVCCNLWE